MIYPWDPGTLWIGLDPSTQATGFAWRFWNGSVLVKGCCDLSILEPDRLRAKLVALVAQGPVRVMAAVEYPAWNAGGSPVVRSMANLFVRILHESVKGVQVVKVNPNDWQKKMLNGAPGKTTKEQSIFRAEGVEGYVCRGSNDSADAACILEYLRSDPSQAKAKRSNVRKKKTVTQTWKPTHSITTQLIPKPGSSPKKKRSL